MVLRELISPHLEVTLNYIDRRTANKFPRKTVLVYEDRRMSYKELYERANRLTNGLLRLGLQKGDRVGVLLYNSTEYYRLGRLQSAEVIRIRRTAYGYGQAALFGYQSS